MEDRAFGYEKQNAVHWMFKLSHDLIPPQRADLVLGKLELGQNLVGLFTELRRPRRHLAWRTRQREGLADQANVAAFGVRHVLGDAEMLHLRIREHLVDRIDRAARHAGGIEFLHPGLARFFLGELVDLGVECFSVLRAVGTGGVFGPVRQIGRADGFGKALPDPSPRGGDVDIAVGGLEHAGRNRRRVVVAGLFGDILVHQPARGLEIQHENLRLQQRGFDPLAFAGNFALEKRGQDSHGAKKSLR